MSYGQPGDKNPNWRGGRCRFPDGRLQIYAPEHPRARNCYVFEYVLIAEKALGKYLPRTAVVHHVNGDPTDNSNQNLVVCENQSYHAFLHMRMRYGKHYVPKNQRPKSPKGRGGGTSTGALKRWAAWTPEQRAAVIAKGWETRRAKATQA